MRWDCKRFPAREVRGARDQPGRGTLRDAERAHGGHSGPHRSVSKQMHETRTLSPAGNLPPEVAEPICRCRAFRRWSLPLWVKLDYLNGNGTLRTRQRHGDDGEPGKLIITNAVTGELHLNEAVAVCLDDQPEIRGRRLYTRPFP